MLVMKQAGPYSQTVFAVISQEQWIKTVRSDKFVKSVTPIDIVDKGYSALRGPRPETTKLLKQIRNAVVTIVDKEITRPGKIPKDFRPGPYSQIPTSPQIVRHQETRVEHLNVVVLRVIDPGVSLQADSFWTCRPHLSRPVSQFLSISPFPFQRYRISNEPEVIQRLTAAQNTKRYTDY